LEAQLAVANEEATAASAKLLIAKEELSTAASQLDTLRRVEGELRHDLEVSQDEARPLSGHEVDKCGCQRAVCIPGVGS
jgi:uncharacterized protein YigA (DUF484 family)